MVMAALQREWLLTYRREAFLSSVKSVLTQLNSMALHLCKTGGFWRPFMFHGALPVGLQCEWEEEMGS